MILNFTESHATREQVEAGVSDGNTVMRNYVRSALRNNHPSSGRAKLIKTAHQMTDRIVSDTAWTHVRGALLPASGNLVQPLAKQLRMFNITPYQWVNNKLHEVSDDC